MKKILFCTSSLSKTHTGAAVFAQLFLQWAMERSIEVSIISPEQTTSVKTIPFVRHRKLFTKIPILQTYHRSFIYYKTVKKQITEAKTKGKKFDLIFFNSAVESLHSAKLVHEIPVWAFLHDENFMNDYLQNPSWKRKLYRNLLKRHEAKAVQFLDRVLTNSQYMKQSIVKIYNIHPIKVDYSHFRSFDLKGSETVSPFKDVIKILFIKHDAERGGLELLLNVLAKFKDENITLHLVGVDSSYLKKYKVYNSKSKIKLDAYLSRKELHYAFLDADIFCVPSFSEALGLANFEALQYGKPVVVLDIPVMRELVRIEPMYFLTSPEDLFQTITHIIESPEARTSKREAGFRFLREKLSKDKVFDRWDTLFQLY